MRVIERLKAAFGELPFFGTRGLGGLPSRIASRFRRRGASAPSYEELLSSAAILAVGWMQRATHGLRFQVTGRDEAEVMTGPARELADVLNRSRGEFLSTAMRDRSLVGNALYRLDEEPAGRRLTYLPFHRVRGLMESRRDYIATELAGIEVQVRDSQRVRLMAGEFLHIRNGVDPRLPAWGHSPLAGAIEDLVSDQQAARTIAAVLRNIARIGLVVQPSSDYKQPFSGPDHATITNMVREQFGSDDAGGEAVFNRRLDLSYPKPNSLEGLAMREVRDVIEDRVCVALGIHSSVVGFSGGMRATRIGAVQSSNVRSTWEGGLIPVITDIAEQAGDFLLPLYDFDPDAYSLGVDLSKVRTTYETPSERAERLGNLVGDDVITPQDAKAILERAGDL